MLPCFHLATRLLNCRLGSASEALARVLGFGLGKVLVLWMLGSLLMRWASSWGNGWVLSLAKAQGLWCLSGGLMAGVLYGISVFELRTQSGVVWGPALAFLVFGK